MTMMTMTQVPAFSQMIAINSVEILVKRSRKVSYSFIMHVPQVVPKKRPLGVPSIDHVRTLGRNVSSSASV